MNKKNVLIGVFVVFAIILYVLGNISYVSAESGRDGNEDREDDARVSADLRGDSLDDDSDDSSGRDTFRTRERRMIVGADGVEREIEIRERVRADGSFERHIKFKMKGDSEDEVEVEIEDDMEIEEEVGDDNETRLRVKFSNGRNADVKVMPDVASARALEALRLHVCSMDNNCTIALKDVGVDNVSNKLIYELRAEKRFRMFWLFERRAEVRAEINADSGEIVDTDKPWWTAFSSEIDDSDSSVSDVAQ
ncbi:hypothetical protein AUJ84_04340 [Candidatus Pacearchaeota archaeon CG1_02_32_132]|nr:MAG: hypothetical protein AUJ84_04340 [Candidatus Pacearchaeota archaeon CG1_02_32_132]